MIAKVVLIVDDEPDAADIGSTLLRHHGYEVLVATSGEEALMIAKQRCPDLIVMDVMLPGVDGWTTTARLKGSTETAGIPVLVTTVRATRPDRETSFEAGADSHLVKPVEPSRLLEEVVRFIGTPGSAA